MSAVRGKGVEGLSTGVEVRAFAVGLRAHHFAKDDLKRVPFCRRHDRSEIELCPQCLRQECLTVGGVKVAAVVW